jgi:hypothetical protein
MSRKTVRELLMPSSYSLELVHGRFWFVYCSVSQIQIGFSIPSLGEWSDPGTRTRTNQTAYLSPSF